MAQNTIGSAYIQILPTTDGIKDQLTTALSGQTESAGKSAGKSLGKSIAGGLATSAAAIGTAAVAAIGSVVASTNAAASAGDAIDKTSQKIGVSAEQYQALAYAAEHCGFETSSFQMAARNLADTDFSGNVYDAMNAIMGLETAEERTAMATELFGERSAQQMAAFINGTDSADDYAKALSDLGGMMSNEAVKDAAAYEDAMTDMNTAITGMKNSLVTDFMPAMTEIMNGVAAVASGNMEGIEQISGAIDAFLAGLIDKIPGIIEFGSELVMSLAEAIIDNLPKIMEVGMTAILKLADGLANKLPELIPKAAEIVITIVTGLVNNIPKLIEAALKLITGLGEGLIKALPQLIANGPTIVIGIVKGLLTALPQMVNVGGQLIAGLANGIIQGLAGCLDAVVGVAKQIVNSVKSFFGIHSPSRLFRDEIGENLMAGFAQGITQNSDMVEDAMDDVSALATGAIETDMKVTASANGSASSYSSLAASVNALSERIDKLSGFAFDLYLDGKQITDCVTARQRRTARAMG